MSAFGTRRAEVPAQPADVGYRWNTGQHMLNASFSHFDPERNSLGVYKCCLKRLDPYSITLSTLSRNEVASERLD